MDELIEQITWRTTERMADYTWQRIRFFFIEEWVRYFFFIFPFVAYPVVAALWERKFDLEKSIDALATPFLVAAFAAVVLSFRNAFIASRQARSEFELNETEVQVRNRARQISAHWDNVRKWSLRPHPYARGMQVLTFFLIESTEHSKSRRIDMEVDPRAVDLAQMEGFIMNRVGFGAAPA